MRIWVDAQMSPAVAVWISNEFAVDAVAVRISACGMPKTRKYFKRRS